MPVEPFGLWWCCLRPQERDTIKLLVLLWFVNPLYVDKSVFDGITAITGENASIKMLATFKSLYGLTDGVASCGEDCIKDVVYFDLFTWGAIYTFSLTDQYICAVPCKLLTFST